MIDQEIAELQRSLLSDYDLSTANQLFHLMYRSQLLSVGDIVILAMFGLPAAVQVYPALGRGTKIPQPSKAVFKPLGNYKTIKICAAALKIVLADAFNQKPQIKFKKASKITYAELQEKTQEIIKILLDWQPKEKIDPKPSKWIFDKAWGPMYIQGSQKFKWEVQALLVHLVDLKKITNPRFLHHKPAVEIFKSIMSYVIQKENKWNRNFGYPDTEKYLKKHKKRILQEIYDALLPFVSVLILVNPR